MRNYDALYQEVVNSNLNVEEFKRVVYQLIGHNRLLSKRVQYLARSALQQRKLIFILEHSLSLAMSELRAQFNRVKSVASALELSKSSLEQTLKFLSESVRSMANLQFNKFPMESLAFRKRKVRTNAAIEEIDQPSCSSHVQNGYISPGRGQKRMYNGSSVHNKKSKMSASRHASQDEHNGVSDNCQKPRTKLGRPRGRPSKLKDWQKVNGTNRKSVSVEKFGRVRQSGIDENYEFLKRVYAYHEEAARRLSNIPDESSADESQNEEPVPKQKSYRKRRSTREESSLDEESQNEESYFEEQIPRRKRGRPRRNVSRFNKKSVSRKRLLTKQRNAAEDTESSDAMSGHEMSCNELNFPASHKMARVVVVLNDVLKDPVAKRNPDVRKFVENCMLTNNNGYVSNSEECSDNQPLAESEAQSESDSASNDGSGSEEKEHVNQESSSEYFVNLGPSTSGENPSVILEDNCDFEEANSESEEVLPSESDEHTEPKKSAKFDACGESENETYTEVELTVSDDENPVERTNGEVESDSGTPQSPCIVTLARRGPRTPPYPVPYKRSGPYTPPGSPPETDE